MKKLLVIFFLINAVFASSQNITGTVKDADQGALLSATAMLMNARDSVLSSFAITDAEGKFVIKKAFNGDYILQINFVGYETFSNEVTIKGEDVHLGNIILEPSLMDDLVIEGDRVPIEMKKDTIEYNAAAFKTQPNAVVEDLLKKLPGVEVDRDGSVKAQGEDVTKVLVDGKEFFGDDLQMATKNLEADAVDKVQIFDKKSEFSEFSGIDDGNEYKTINLSLKEDRKTGTFGRVGGGLGTDERYRLEANINKFRKDNQFSIVAKNNNINEQGFSVSDYIGFMGGMSNLGGGRGSFSIGGGGLSIGNDLSSGFVTTTTTGLNFNRDFSEKSELQTNYIFTRIRNVQNVNTQSTNFLEESSFDTDSESKSESLTNMHSMSVNYKYKLNKATDVQIRNSLSFNSGEIEGNSESFVTGSNRNTTATESSLSNSNALNLNSRLILRRRFDKPGRTLVAEGRITQNVNDGQSELITETRDGSDAVIQQVNQETVSDNRSTTLGTEISFTEPIGKSKYMEVRYVRENTMDTDDREVFDIDGNARAVNDNLTQLYDRKLTTDRVGGGFNYIRDKFRFTLGTNYQSSQLGGRVDGDNSSIDNTFQEVLPYLRTEYEFTNSIRMSLNYNTTLQVPSVRQLQPILDNSNPLNLYQGNPNLDAQYMHSARVHFSLFDQFTSKSFFTTFSANVVQENIVTTRTFDEITNVTFSTPENIGQSVTLTNYASFGGRIRFAKMKYYINNRVSKITSNIVVNDITSESQTVNNTFGVNIENAKKEKVDWIIGTKYTIGRTVAEENVSANQEYANTAYFTDVTVYMKKKWSITSNFDITTYSDENIGGGNSVPLWQASVQKDFLKNDRGQLKFSVFDLLDENVGINRSTNVNYVQEQVNQSLGRYYMIAFTYKLSDHQAGGFMKMGHR